MKKSVLFISLFFLSPLWAGETADLEKVQALAKQEGKPILLDFYADW